MISRYLATNASFDNFSIAICRLFSPIFTLSANVVCEKAIIALQMFSGEEGSNKKPLTPHLT